MSREALAEFTDEQLLFELLCRNRSQPAPKRTEYYGDDWHICTVGVGNDASVTITFDADDLKALATEVMLHE